MGLLHAQNFVEDDAGVVKRVAHNFRVSGGVHHFVVRDALPSGPQLAGGDEGGQHRRNGARGDRVGLPLPGQGFDHHVVGGAGAAFELGVAAGVVKLVFVPVQRLLRFVQLPDFRVVAIDGIEQARALAQQQQGFCVIGFVVVEDGIGHGSSPWAYRVQASQSASSSPAGMPTGAMVRAAGRSSTWRMPLDVFWFM